jgi:ribosome-binding protein aMBF1 (putative translation factor)
MQLPSDERQLKMRLIVCRSIVYRSRLLRTMDIRKQVGINVRRLREGRELSQEELAFEAELHRTYISGVERGVRNPTVTVVAKIAKALGVTPDQLLRPGR